MTKYICDLCGEDRYQSDMGKVEFNDGEHPHNGSTMTTVADVCVECMVKLPGLRTTMEISEARK